MNNKWYNIDPQGKRVKYDPAGVVMPIEDDACNLGGQCLGVVEEVAVEEVGTFFLVRWETCCKLHHELDGGHMAEAMLIQAGVTPEMDRKSPLGCTWEWGVDLTEVEGKQISGDPVVAKVVAKMYGDGGDS